MHPVLLALLSAALFGVSMPGSKLLLQYFSPQQMAGLLYLGMAAGIAPAFIKGGIRNPLSKLARADRIRLSVSLIGGGIFAPILLMVALKLGDAVTVSMLLCSEAPMTALLAYFLFKEHISKRGWTALAGTTVAALLLSFNLGYFGVLSSLAAVAACFCWSADNNMISVVDSVTPAELTLMKGLTAGAVNSLIGISLSPISAPAPAFAYAIICGALCYGLSCYLYIQSAQKLGASRSQMIFASSPFWGVAAAALIFQQNITLPQLGAGALFIASLGMLMRDQHSHSHRHAAVSHTHEHGHDDGHHGHEHADGSTVAGKHTHWHEHPGVDHAHPHWPDLHHRHSH